MGGGKYPPFFRELKPAAAAAAVVAAQVEIGGRTDFGRHREASLIVEQMGYLLPGYFDSGRSGCRFDRDHRGKD